MIKFAFKNMAIKKVQCILIVISIVISASIAVLAYNVSSQVSDGITSNAGYYSVIIGPSGSKTQLAMNTMYFSDEPLGTIPYSVAMNLMQDGTRVNKVIPFAMADNYNGSKVVGTTSLFLKNKSLQSGEMMDDSATMQAVVGYNVAKNNGLSVGDVIYTSHSASSYETHTKGITITGILNQSYSSFDNVVFTQVRTLWEMHEHEGEEEHSHEATVCAVIVNTKNPAYAMQIVNEYNGKTFTDAHGDAYSTQAIEPMDAIREVLNETDDTKYIVFVLCGIILIMNIIVISIITLLNMYHSSKEIALMRLIGISMKRINLLYLIQNGIIGILSILLAFGASRLCMGMMNDYVSSMGVVLNMGKVYGAEIGILLAVFLISVIPTLIWTFVMSKRDAMEG